MGDRDDAVLTKALRARRQTRGVAFRAGFDPDDPAAWCDLLKDTAALANSGGGAIVVGVDRGGTASGGGAAALLETDPETIAGRFAPYLGETFDGFHVRRATRDGATVAVVLVDERTGSPLVFEHAGTYADDAGQERTVFGAGSIYFRHGARSEPAIAADLKRFTQREVQRQQRDWGRNVRKVVAAPPGAHVVVMKPKSGAPELVSVRVVEDGGAPAVARADFDVTHPYRQTEIVKAFNERLGRAVVGPYDMQCVRKVHRIDTQPRFFHLPKFGSPQYSEAFLSWLLARYAEDQGFFEQAKDAMRALRAAHTG